MVSFLYGPREQHRVNSVEKYLKAHRTAIAKKQHYGSQFVVHDEHAPIAAQIRGNAWVIQCECGAGNATDPQWQIACCFACGAVHRQVVFPKDAAAIEKVLLERPKVQNRHWMPGETVDDLIAENVAHGVRRMR